MVELATQTSRAPLVGMRVPTAIPATTAAVMRVPTTAVAVLVNFGVAGRIENPTVGIVELLVEIVWVGPLWRQPTGVVTVVVTKRGAVRKMGLIRGEELDFRRRRSGVQKRRKRSFPRLASQVPGKTTTKRSMEERKWLIPLSTTAI